MNKNQDANGRFVAGNKTSGGKKGRSGRRKSEVVAIERLIVEKPDEIQTAWKQLMKLVRSGNLEAIKYRLDRAWGKPTIKLSGDPNRPPLTVQIMPPLDLSPSPSNTGSS